MLYLLNEGCGQNFFCISHKTSSLSDCVKIKQYSIDWNIFARHATRAYFSLDRRLPLLTFVARLEHNLPTDKTKEMPRDKITLCFWLSVAF